MTSRNVLAVVFLGTLAFSSVGCPNKQKDGGAAEAAGSAAPGAQAPSDAEKDDERDKDDDEDDEKGEANKKDEGGW